MPQFTVKIIEGGSKEVTVEAEDPTEAEEKVRAEYENGTISLDPFAGESWVDFEVQ